MSEQQFPGSINVSDDLCAAVLPSDVGTLRHSTHDTGLKTSAMLGPLPSAGAICVRRPTFIVEVSVTKDANHVMSILLAHARIRGAESRARRSH